MSDPDQTESFGIAAQARLAAIVESSDDAIIGKSLEGIILSWNKGAQRIFGYTAEEVVGKSLTILIPADRLDEEPQILSRLRKGERVEHYETIRMAKGGKLLDISVTVSPIRDTDGRVVGASKIARDITDQKRVQRELNEAKEAAEAANVAKDRFLSVLSHELRTPLTPVLAAVAMIEKQPGLSSELREQLDMIHRNVETEARLIDDLMDLTRLARGEVELDLETIDAHSVVRNVIAMFRNQIDFQRLVVTLELTAPEHELWVDSGRFHQVLMNLISNAVKFTPDRGSITVRSSNMGDHLKIEIIDTGVGIEPEVLPRLFEAFEQGERVVTRRFGGLGLGLSIVKSLVQMHKGQITATSAGKNQGATFTVEFPNISAAQTHPQQTTAEVKAKKPCRILLVEDHADTRQVLSVLLRSFGCDVSAVGSVKEAMEIGERERFDLLVSDIGLPDGTGNDVMRYLHERQKIKGIAMSGFGQDEDLRRSREAGFATHLTKPINFKTLHEEILKIAG
jgi:PAS domain S-box-containing protein